MQSPSGRAGSIYPRHKNCRKEKIIINVGFFSCTASIIISNLPRGALAVAEYAQTPKMRGIVPDEFRTDRRCGGSNPVSKPLSKARKPDIRRET